MRWAALLALFAGCRAKPLPPPTLADLNFPVAVNYQRGGVVLFTDAVMQGKGKVALTAGMLLAAIAVGTHLARKHYARKRKPAA